MYGSAVKPFNTRYTNIHFLFCAFLIKRRQHKSAYLKTLIFHLRHS